jgi:hypothetical protein
MMWKASLLALLLAYTLHAAEPRIVIDEDPDVRGAPSQYRAAAVGVNPIDARGVHKMWIVVPHLSDMQNLTTYAEAQAMGEVAAAFVAHESQGLLTLEVEIIEVTTPTIASTWNCIEQPEVHTTGSVWDYVPYLDAAMLELGYDKFDGPLLMQVLMPTSPTMNGCLGTGVAYPNNIHSFVQREANWELHDLDYFSIHEFGHNFNLGHDGTDWDNDGFDSSTADHTYGAVDSPQGNPLYYYVGWSAANHKQLGWKQGQNIQHPDLCAEQSYNLYPVEGTMTPQSITIPDDRFDGGQYVLSPRSDEGMSGNLTGTPEPSSWPRPWELEQWNRMLSHTQGLTITRFSWDQQYLNDNYHIAVVLPDTQWNDGRYKIEVAPIQLGALPVTITDLDCNEGCHP